MKELLAVLKKIVFSVVILYSYNMLAKSLNMIIPINLATILTITIFGTPALFFLISILFICF